MRKIIYIVMFMAIVSLGYAQHSTSGINRVSKGANLLYDNLVSLDSANASSTDSVTVSFDIANMDCDSITYVYELVSADSLLIGTAKDSISSYARIRYYTPDRAATYTNTWATDDTLWTDAYTLAPNALWRTYRIDNYKISGTIRLLLINHYASVGQTIRVRVWAIKRWLYE